MALETPSVVGDPEGRQCWVCFGTDEDSPDVNYAWVKPCRCRGSTRWVHQPCVQQWVEQKQRGQLTTPVHCPQCQTAYAIQYPHMGMPLVGLEHCDKLIQKASPIGLATVVGMALYWNSFSYGLFTVYVMLGKEETVALLERADPIFVVVGLPLLPVTLIIVNSIPWVEKAIAFCCNVIGPRMQKSWLLSYLAPSPIVQPPGLVEHNSLPNIARTVCGALLMPYMATLFGQLMFHSVKKNWKRVCFGGLTYLILKATVKLYLRINQYKRLGRRVILDHPDNY